MYKRTGFEQLYETERVLFCIKNSFSVYLQPLFDLLLEVNAT